MDSLTQIVLGAYCGERVLGKKMGNKALLFGAIGGTLPDLDILVGPYLYSNEIDNLLFHRGVSHSLLFSIVASWVFGWFSYKGYELVIKNKINLRTWVWFYFLAFFTHVILDCFTGYGTGVFEPFSNYRVAWNTISVVDPLYTLPFLVGLVVAMFYKRTSAKRKKWAQIGFGLSTAYLFLTVLNYYHIRQIFDNSFSKTTDKIERFSIQPTIFNNLLWYGIAETQGSYLVGMYSLLDSKSEVQNILTIPKKRPYGETEQTRLKKLELFSNNYFNYIKTPEGVKYVDLRYPLLNEKDKNSSVFSFYVVENDKGIDIKPFQRPDFKKSDVELFWNRIKGI